MPALILFSKMWASCIITQSNHPFGEEIRLYSYWPSFPSGPYLSRGGAFLKTVFTIVTSSVPELTVGLVFVVTCATVGLVFVVTCVTVGLVFVVTCVTVGLVFVVTCVTVGLVFVVTCVTVGLVVVVTCVTVGLVFVVTCVTVGLVFVVTCVTVGLVVTCMTGGLLAVPFLASCALLIIHTGHNQDLLLFGILFLPRQDKWKNLPLVQLVLEHLTSLSFFSATALHVQIEFIFIASLRMLADCCLEPPRLNSGKALHFGQYQVLGIASMPRHDK